MNNPHIYGILCNEFALCRSTDADVFNAIRIAKAKAHARTIKVLAETRPIRLLAGSHMERITPFCVLALELDITPTISQHLSFDVPGEVLGENDVRQLISESIWKRDSAYVIAVGDEESGIVLLHTILRVLFNGKDLERSSESAFAMYGWKLDMVTGELDFLIPNKQ